MKKRLLSMVLPLVLFLSMLPQFSRVVSAKSWIKDGTDAKGSDYSVEYAAKLDSIFQGKVSLFSNTGDKFPLGSNLNNSSEYRIANNYYSGYQCYIYAQAVYYYLFGDVVYHGNGSKYWSDSQKVISNQTTASYDLFSKAGVGFGAYLRTTTKTDGSYSNSGHSIIVLSYNRIGMTFLEGNAHDYGNGYICITTRTWDEFNTDLLSAKGRRIGYVVQCKSAQKEHNFDNLGICSKGDCACGYEFDFNSTFNTKSAGYYTVSLNGGIYLRTDKPYSASSAKSNLIAKGTKVEVLGSVTNHYETDNVWYKVSYNGVVGYTHMNNLTWAGYGEQQITCTITSPAEGESVPKKAYPVIGTVTSKYPIQEVVAYIDGTKYATVTVGSDKTLALRETAINDDLSFSSLSVGSHTLVIKARDIHRSSLTTICTRNFKISGTTTCSHSYSSKVTKSATCTSTGVRKYTCSKCNASYTESIPATGHSYTSISLTSPTCTKEGYATYTCGKCGFSYDKIDEPATGHSYVGKVTRPATCTTRGIRTYTCSVCDYSFFESFDTIKHDYVGEVTRPATCTTRGIRTYTCSMCEDSFFETFDTIEHNYNVTETTPATCTSGGTELYVCSGCGDGYILETDRLGHIWEIATCTTPETCSRCRATEGKALGHRFVDYISNNDATCVTDGTETAKCDRCAETDTKTVVDSQLGHSFTNYVSDNNATYEADGTKTAQCDRCDAIRTVADDGSKLIRNGWHLEGTKWYYYRNDTKTVGWLKEGNTWYYLKPSGAMATGWANVGGVYYYFNASGAMQTGWLKSGNTWYYLKSSGAMATGWAQVGGKWYYFNGSGAMVTGWQKVGGVWYYFQSGGAMQTGWLKLGSTWYYFQSSGAMATGSVKIGAKTYRFNASGACLNP